MKQSGRKNRKVLRTSEAATDVQCKSYFLLLKRESNWGICHSPSLSHITLFKDSPHVVHRSLFVNIQLKAFGENSSGFQKVKNAFNKLSLASSTTLKWSVLYMLYLKVCILCSQAVQFGEWGGKKAIMSILPTSDWSMENSLDCSNIHHVLVFNIKTSFIFNRFHLIYCFW